jgi:hypothetical protein
MSGKVIVLLIVAGVVLIGVGFGSGYLVFQDRTSIKTSAKDTPTSEARTSPSPEASPSPSPTPSPSPSEAAIPPGWSLCTNPVKKFSIGYPGGWVTRNEGAEDACGIFDPEAIDYPREGPSSAGMIVIAALTTTVDELVTQITAPEAERRVLKKEESRIGERRAVILETEATGRGDETGRSRIYEYVVDKDGAAFTVRTYAEPNRLSRHAEFRSVIDQAVKTLKFL